MEKKTLGLIHTSATLVPVFEKLCEKYLPNLKVFNIVDDSLIKNTIACGELTPQTSKRVVGYAGFAEDAGADYILFTCSSIGRAVETAATLTSVPVLRVDYPMANKAVALGQKIGIIATLSTTLKPTTDIVKKRAEAAGKKIDLISRVCKGAFEALMNGDVTTHDDIVASALKALSEEVDVILLAQASMARVVDILSEEDKKVPILSSPQLAVEFLAQELA